MRLHEFAISSFFPMFLAALFLFTADAMAAEKLKVVKNKIEFSLSEEGPSFKAKTALPSLDEGINLLGDQGRRNNGLQRLKQKQLDNNIILKRNFDNS